MKNQKGQILLVVFMLLLFSSIILGGVVLLWQSSLNTTALQKESLRAFYLAQSGIERGLAELMYRAEVDSAADVESWIDDTQPQIPATPLAGGTYTVTLYHPASGPPATRKQMIYIVGTGVKGNSQRTISLYLLLSVADCEGKRGKSGNCGEPYGWAWGYWSKFETIWEEQ